MRRIPELLKGQWAAEGQNRLIFSDKFKLFLLILDNCACNIWILLKNNNFVTNLGQLSLNSQPRATQ